MKLEEEVDLYRNDLRQCSEQLNNTSDAYLDRRILDCEDLIARIQNSTLDKRKKQNLTNDLQSLIRNYSHSKLVAFIHKE